jgi:hypothetical protein
MTEVVSALVWREVLENLSDAIPERTVSLRRGSPGEDYVDLVA